MRRKFNKNLTALMENHQSDDRRYYVSLCGSTRSGKTWAALDYLITLSAQHKGLVTDVFRFDARRHDSGAASDFCTMMQSQYHPLWEQGRWNRQTRVFDFANGSVIRFNGTQDREKLHGPARDFALFNEVNEHDMGSFHQIEMRTRLGILCDCNPVDMEHPILKMLAANPRCLHIHSTYKDNPHLTREQVRVIEAYNPDDPKNVEAGTADRYMWEVYALGKPARREGSVFEKWDVTDFWPTRDQCQRSMFGLDWGYAMDPTALIAMRLYRGELYLREYVYEKGLLHCANRAEPNVPSLEHRLHDLRLLMNQGDTIYCDSADPEAITQLRLLGYPLMAAEKGAGSVLEGISRLKQFPLHIHRSSTNLQFEMRNYVWRNRLGQWLTEPEDRHNHLIDAARYASIELKPSHITTVSSIEKVPVSVTRFREELSKAKTFQRDVIRPKKGLKMRR